MAAALVSGSLAAVWQAWSPSVGATDDVGRTGDDGRTVALVTGDRVLVSQGSGRVTPIAGKGRDGMQFSIQHQGDHTYVIPMDAVRLLASGALDRYLFDVAYLAKEGYDSRSVLPLIVQGDSGVRSLAGTEAARPLSTIGGTALRIPKGDDTFWRSVAGKGTVTGRATLAGGARKIWLDRTLRLQLDRSVPQIGAPDAWKAGYTGTGVKVAVLDSGVDATHPDLAGRVAVRKNFTEEPDTDLAGHGTHVAATIASVDPVYRGVAPDASLLIGKVCLRDGRCEMSGVMAAMEWASTEQHARVVNMSMGGQDSPGVDPLEEMINRLTAQNGTLFVIGSGNNGQGGEQTVASPSTADAALSVGAVDRDDKLAFFSGRGPRLGDSAIKPEVTAPGVGIMAARSRDGDLGEPGQLRMTGSGTSMAAPHVTGAAALVFQQHPDWTAEEVKAALMASAKPDPAASSYDQGAGRVDLTRAITQTVLPEQPGLSFGKARWPHTDDEPTTRRLTYRNTGDVEVTLNLVASAAGPDGTPANGMFTLSTTSLTVPAGGTASVDVTANTRGDMPDGSYTGGVVATGDGTTVRTPIAVVREVESYDLTVTALDRAGNPTPEFMPALAGYGGLTMPEESVDADGTRRLRVPRDRYALTVEVPSGADGADGTDLVQAPWLDMSADRAITVDTRATTPVSVTVQRQDAALVDGTIGNVMLPDGADFVAGWLNTPDLSRVRTAQIGPDAPADRFVGAQQTTFAVPGAGGDFANSPYVYHLARFSPGTVITGSQQVRDRDLASVRTENLSQGTGGLGMKGAIATSRAMPAASFPGTVLLPMSLPRTSEELFSTEGVTWKTLFFENPQDQDPERSDARQVAPMRSYRAGRSYTERWNGGGVFGPSLPALPSDVAEPWAAQRPGGLQFQVPLFGSTADTAGQSKLDSARTVVLRADDTNVCQSDSPTCLIRGNLPPGSYHATTEATRTWTDLSTKVSAAWTFTHDGTPALPLQVVRFHPVLDSANSAEGGQPFAVPVTVQRNPGAAEAKVASLTVEVSYDDGAHWAKAPMVGGTAMLRHPASGYVSLRATVTDTGGNTVEQTILHAYRLR